MRSWRESSPVVMLGGCGLMLVGFAVLVVVGLAYECHKCHVLAVCR